MTKKEKELTRFKERTLKFFRELEEGTVVKKVYYNGTITFMRPDAERKNIWYDGEDVCGLTSQWY